MTSAELIRRVGTALFGGRYESELAIALHVNRRTVRRWKKGEAEPSKDRWDDIVNLTIARSWDLEQLITELCDSCRGSRYDRY